MSGISIEVGLDAAEARNRLQDMIARMARPRPFYAEVGDILVGSAGRNFQAQTGPDGRKWTPLRPGTISARIRKGQVPITILRGNRKGVSGTPLAGSISHEASDDGVRVGSPIPYAAIHQLGGTIEKPAGTGWKAGRRFAKRSEAPEGRDVAIPAHRITIPARPYLGVSAADQEEIFDAAEYWLSP